MDLPPRSPKKQFNVFKTCTSKLRRERESIIPHLENDRDMFKRSRMSVLNSNDTLKLRSSNVLHDITLEANNVPQLYQKSPDEIRPKEPTPEALSQRKRRLREKTQTSSVCTTSEAKFSEVPLRVLRLGSTSKDPSPKHASQRVRRIREMCLTGNLVTVPILSTDLPTIVLGDTIPIPVEVITRANVPIATNREREVLPLKRTPVEKGKITVTVPVDVITRANNDVTMTNREREFVPPKRTFAEKGKFIVEPAYASTSTHVPMQDTREALARRKRNERQRLLKEKRQRRAPSTRPSNGLQIQGRNIVPPTDVSVVANNSDTTVTEAIPQPQLAPVNILPFNNRRRTPRQTIDVHHHDLGQMDVICRHCLALHWMDEKLSDSGVMNPRFGMCCTEGKINLPNLRTPPTQLKQLFDGTNPRETYFRLHAREYNNALAFTSLGVNPDLRAIATTGPRPFSIHGELRHRTGGLNPEGSDREASYAQLYIYDPDEALRIRNNRNKELNGELMQIIQNVLLSANPFVSRFRQAYDILQSENRNGREIPAYLHYSAAKKRGTYNLPTVDEIDIILPGDGYERSKLRDIVLHRKSGQALERISECHPAYLPLHYVLFFPYGELGWTDGLQHYDTILRKLNKKRLTRLQWFNYRLFPRIGEYSSILRGQKLFQEFIVDAWAATEQNNLAWVRANQRTLRSELYQDLNDVFIQGREANDAGRIVLPSSHIGSPRHMFGIYQDSMAITRYNHHPDIFLTMTANPKWPEITAALLPRQHPLHRPDIVARVFDLKRKALLKDINENKVFGDVVGSVYTIEFQKRGLPHMHLLLFLRHEHKIRSSADVDRLISAELPDPDVDREYYDTITTCMLHGPCGERNLTATCMVNGMCSKKYPREFTETTTMNKEGYPVYRRRDTRRFINRTGIEMTNKDVVPHNPYLAKKYNCHINVEVCAGLRCVKYIHKYIYKGNDRTTMIVGSDEVQQYLDARYIGAPEAAWRIFGFSLHEEKPHVERLEVHLPGQFMVVFDPQEPLESVLDRARTQRSKLTSFFECCASDESARIYTYEQFPQHYVWIKARRAWKKRDLGCGIGHMYFAAPNQGERFYLRLLLSVVPGPTSFEYLRQVDSVLYNTFKESCNARGLLEDDSEWFHCLEEASIIQTGHQLRRLFAVILIHCDPAQPLFLWQRFREHICDDLSHRIQMQFNIANPTDNQVEDYGLFLLNGLLEELGKSLKKFPPMPESTMGWTTISVNRLQHEHNQLRYEAEQLVTTQTVDLLNPCQRQAFDLIYNSFVNGLGKIFFVNGGAGTGKTFLYNMLAIKCRAGGHIVLTVASSGIAALLLIGGKTAHSTFTIPINIDEKTVCNISKQSQQGDLICSAKLIIWDEVPMQNKYCVEVVDRTLRDLCDNNNAFGGKTVVLGGDFRQILPVIQKGSREEVVAATFRRSYLWPDVQVLTLSTNMRLQSGNHNNIRFAEFLQKIGSDPAEEISIPKDMHKCKTLIDLIRKVYPNLNIPETVTAEYLTDRIILSARNDDVLAINSEALNIFRGETFKYLAADKLIEDVQDHRTLINYPNEFLNSLNPSGLPPFCLELKVGSPIMLLRNIAPKDGLCNGTRLMVSKCATRVIEAKILTGDKAGNLVLIPRISLSPTNTELAISMSRRQFPVRLAYAMTINKSQGQSVKEVGVDLRTPVFSHGQLYVALSRCTNFDSVSVLLPNANDNTTTNIVYPEVLL